MGQLKRKPRPPQRARQPEAKAERRRVLLPAASTLFASTPYHEVRVSDVARAAGLAKGTVFLYFPSKEALFLALLDDSLASFFRDLEAALVAAKGKLGPARLAELFTAAALSHPTLVRLFGLLATVLEQALDVETLVAWKTRLVSRLAGTGAVLERRAELSPGSGAALLLRIYALTIGLRQLAEPGPAARQAQLRPGLEPLAIDLGTELPHLLHALLLGLGQLTDKEPRR